MAEPSLTARDLALFGSLREYRVLTTEQVQTVHFASRQTMLRRVRLLARCRYVRVAPAPTLGTRVVTLAERGLAELPEEGEAGLGPVRRRGISALFLPHLIQVNEFRLRLAAACAARVDLELVRFIPESARRSAGRSVQPRPCIREEAPDPLRPGALLSRVPDGAFALRRGGKTALLFLEVDRGSEVVGHPDRGMGKIVRFYAALLLSGGYQRYGEMFGATEPFRGFRALLILPCEGRLRSVRERCGRRPDVHPQARRFIWLAASPALFAGDLLASPWVSLDPTDAMSYVLDGARRAEGAES